MMREMMRQARVEKSHWKNGGRGCRVRVLDGFNPGALFFEVLVVKVVTSARDEGDEVENKLCLEIVRYRADRSFCGANFILFENFVHNAAAAAGLVPAPPLYVDIWHRRFV